MSGDLISRDAVMEAVRVTGVASAQEKLRIMAAVRAVPAVEAEQVVHAHWVAETRETYIPVEFDENDNLVTHKFLVYKCSRCGEIDRKSCRCRGCGAHMDEEVSDG